MRTIYAVHIKGATYDHCGQIVAPIMIRPCTNGFERLSSSLSARCHKWYKDTTTHLFAISINLIHINPIEIKISGVLSTGLVSDQDLQRSELIEIKAAMIAMCDISASLNMSE